MVSKMIFRIDDVSPNTDLFALSEIQGEIMDRFPDAEIWNGFNVFGKSSLDGAVYPGAPFKDREMGFFYDVDSVRTIPHLIGKTVSHGLLHADHSRLQYDAQEMSIVTSCKYIGTDIFIPPFNRYNEATEAVCRINGIKLVRIEDGWRNLDHNDFDPSHSLWYFHPWRYTVKSFKEKLDGALARRN